MSLVPNIGPLTRVAYVVIGLGLILAAWMGPFSGRTLPLIVGALGVVSIVEGAIGF
ncbi:MAG: DUF2892 domain-containing protein [Acidobacteria bacterium]|nr:DUF2892 domain-containing protein [Acidobacteriota bacterium]